MKTGRRKMLDGELYDPMDPELTGVLDVCRVEISSFTLFGPAVQIYTATHPFNAEQRRREEAGTPVYIGSDVWVGGSAIILPGGRIGSREVIGALLR